MSPKQNRYGVSGLSYDKTNDCYIWRNKYAKKPVKWPGKKHTLEQVKKEAEKLNGIARLREAIAKEKSQKPPTISDVIELYIDGEVPLQPWKGKTRRNYIAAYRRFQREFGSRTFITTDRRFYGDWLNNIKGKADTYNGYRFLLIKLCDFAIAKGICDYNEAAATLERSMSPMIAGNKKNRKPFASNLNDALEVFKTIHAIAPDWMQIGMELQLLTAQARQEVCNFHIDDWRDGYLYVIRGKTAHLSDLAFIKIPITPSLESVLKRARSLQPVCPYFVSTKPLRIKPEALAKKPHPAWVNPEHYGKTFSKLRNSLNLYDHLPPVERPGTHEIRALAGKYMESQGIDPQGYYAHGDKRTTKIYTDTPGLLKDSDFKEVVPGVEISFTK